MTTQHPRINVTAERELYEILSVRATKQKKSLSAIAKELMLEALELEEDYALSKIADKRDVHKMKTISHEDMWKHLK